MRIGFSVLSSLFMAGWVATSAQAQPLTFDLTAAVKANGGDNNARDIALGNNSSGSVAYAYAYLDEANPQSGRIETRLRLHNKHQNCVKVFGQKHCVDSYNYWVNVDVTAFVNNCRVSGIVATSSNELYKVATAFSTLLWNGYLQFGVDTTIPACRQ